MVRTLRQSLLLGTFALVLLPGRLLADGGDDQYAVAAGHYAQKRWELAVAEFSDFQSNYPLHTRATEAAFYRGESLVQLGRTQEARAEFQSILARDPGGRFARQALFRNGESAYLSGQLAEAKIDLEQFQAQYSGDPLIAYSLAYVGDIALKQGDPATAEAIFNQALRQFPNSPRSAQYHLGLGRALLEQNRFDEAIEQLTSLAGNAEVGLESQYWLGLAHRATKHWDAAAKTLLAAAGAAGPKDRLLPAIRFHAGDSLLQAGDPQKATEQFDLVLCEAPESRWADDCLAGKLRAASATKDHQAVDRLAMEFAERFGASPLKTEVLLLRVSALMASGKFAGAVAPLEAALAGPIDAVSLPACRAQLAICYTRLRRRDQAKAMLETLLQEHVGHELIMPTIRHLAEAAYAVGEHGWSSTLFAKLVAEGNQPSEVARGLSGLAWSQLKAQALDRAAATFDRLIREHPDDPHAAEAALVRGQIFEQQGKHDPALAMYHRVIDQRAVTAQLPAALLAAARLHDRLHQDDQARTLYEQLVQNHADFEQLDAAIYGWAWVLRELAKQNEAERQFQRLHDEFRMSKHWAEATYLLAQRAAGAERYDRAEELLALLLAASEQGASEQGEQNSSVPPEIVARALYLLGHMAIRREAWAEAEPPMQRLIAEFPDSPLSMAANFWTAEATFRRGEMERAAELFGALADRSRGHEPSWLAMVSLRQGQVLAHQRRWTEALEMARRIETEHPKFAQRYEADYLIGRCLAARGELDDARAAYLKVVRSIEGGKTETAAMAQWMIGETFMHQKKFERARREYLRGEILYAYPQWQARSLLQAGKCYELEGQWKQAIELYVQLAKKYPDSSSTEEAQRRMRVAQQRSASVR